MLHLVKSLFAIAALVLACGENVVGQEAKVPDTIAAGETPVTSDSPLAEPSLPEPSLGVGPGGMQRHVPGRWALLGLGAVNPTDRDVEETMTVIIDGDTNLQYARRLWLPAGSRRQAWMPVRIPEVNDVDQHQIEMTSIRIREGSGATEQFQTDFVGMPSNTRSLLLSEEESRVAIMLDQRPPNASAVEGSLSDEQNAEIAATVNIGRDAAIDSDRDLGPIYINDYLLPSSPVGLDAIDQIVIASDRIIDDTMMLSRLQSWLQAGGQIWLMADRVSPETAQALLGDVMCYSVVDRVELNDVDMTAENRLTGTISQSSWSAEMPVDFVRVFAETDDIVCSVDGWPAAFRKRVGNGELLVTTLGARAWIDRGQPLLIYDGMARKFFGRRSPVADPAAELRSFVDDEIGYEIPGRPLVATLLGVHILAVVAAGVWLAKRRQLQYLAAVIPISSLIAAGIFLFVGKQKTDAVPSTIALSQIVRNLPGTSSASIRSIAAVYSQVTRPLEIVSSSDSMSMLTDGLEDGEVKRVQWDDSGQSQWLYVKQPPGVVRHVETAASREFSPAWMVTGHFTKRGFEGRVKGLEADRCEDAVIVAGTSPSLAVEFASGSGNVFASDRSNVLTAGQYINSAIVSDVQQARQQLLRQMLVGDTPPFGREPILLVWTDPVDSGVEFADDFKRRGSALVSLPVLIEPSEAQSEFQVPSTFVRIESYAGARGTSSLFNSRSGEWIELNRSGEVEVQCMVPEALLPCTLSRADVTIKINAPSRTLEIKCLVDGEFKTVMTKPDPSGLIRFEIVDPKLLSLSEQGGLVMSVNVSETEAERLKAESESLAAAEAASSGALALPADNDPSRSTWKIDYLHVDFEGVTR